MDEAADGEDAAAECDDAVNLAASQGVERALFEFSKGGAEVRESCVVTFGQGGSLRPGVTGERVNGLIEDKG